MSAALIAKLIEAGTPPELVAEVALELGRAQGAVAVLEARKAKDRQRKRDSGSTEFHGIPRNPRNSEESTEIPPGGSPKENNQTPSLPPAEHSEAKASSTQPRAWSLPSGVSLQVWQDFKRNRQRKRLPNTETAWKSFNDDLTRVSAQTGIPPPQLIERCTAKGWGAIYDPRDQRNERSDRDPTTVAVERLLGTHAGTG